MKLDYNLKTSQERLELVNKILEETENPNENYLDILAAYLVVPIEREERKKHEVLTSNRMVTLNRRETSYEGLVSKLENGEDGIYNLIDTTRGKSTIFQPKVSITTKDLETIPFLKQIKEAITYWEKKQKTAVGRDAYIIKKTIIDLRKDQYIIKNSYTKPLIPNKITRSKHSFNIEDSYTFDEEGYVRPEGISLCDPKVCSAVLCNYSQLKEDSWGDFEGDLFYFMLDFDNISEQALLKYPIYEQIVTDKIDNMSNLQIQEDIQMRFGIKHSLEYISSLWRKKIPGLIASAAEDQLLNWHYLEIEKGEYKRCSRCGKIKLAHNKYFSRNKTSRDGYYSICKECRNQKVKKP